MGQAESSASGLQKVKDSAHMLDEVADELESRERRSQPLVKSVQDLISLVSKEYALLEKMVLLTHVHRALLPNPIGGQLEFMLKNIFNQVSGSSGLKAFADLLRFISQLIRNNILLLESVEELEARTAELLNDCEELRRFAENVTLEASRYLKDEDVAEFSETVSRLSLGKK